ncbi:MAG TPA: LacI family DNA-binding transcriptional regulator [Actinomycetota bacterium]|nr:LacI family DNA-binding transcriptional regulator [Actinomycetota bacterium]
MAPGDGMGTDGAKRIGIKEVAEAAGVSITTVSHALSGKGRLPEHTRERVRQVAAELGYVPHPAARSLATGRTGLLATLVSAPGDAAIAFTEIDYYVELLNAATRTALTRGAALVIAPSTAGEETWSRLPLDGVIVVDPADDDAAVALLRTRGVPLVFVGRDRGGPPDDLVVQNDRRAATRAVLDHLRAAGAERPAILSLRTFESFSEECIDAYGDWCDAHAVPPVVHLAAEDSTASPSTIRRVAESFLDRTDQPDAVFCLYERLAVELLAAAREVMVGVPDDLLVATIAEEGRAGGTDPPLTTLEIGQDALGEVAAELLCDVLDGRPAASVLDVPTRLTVRGSTRR